MNNGFRADIVAMLAGGLALALLLGALGFQYVGGIAPCEMCHWQRWPHIAAALFGLGGGWAIFAGIVARRFARGIALGAILLVALSGLIGAYQTGMQFHLLPGPAACTGHRFVLGSNVIPEVQCDVATWTLFGLSLAFYNALFSLGGAAIGLIMLRRSR